MNFNPQQDVIAIAIPAFRVRRGTDGLARYTEPYLVSLAIDESGLANPEPVLHLNSLYFPKVAKWTWVNFGGQGRLVYGPKNPGRFVSYSILFMENDNDVRKLGETVERVVKSAEAQAILGTLTAATIAYQAAALVLTQLTALVAGVLKQNEDDELGRFEGTFFRDFTPPYNIGDQFTHQNDFITCPVKVIPLPQQEVREEIIAANFSGDLPRLV